MELVNIQRMNTIKIPVTIKLSYNQLRILEKMLIDSKYETRSELIRARIFEEVEENAL